MKMFIDKTFSVVKLTIYIAIFVTLTVNSNLIEIILFSPFSEHSFLILSFLTLFAILSAALLLTICYRNTLKPILVTLLIFFSIFNYVFNNFGLVFEQNIFFKTTNSITLDFIKLINFKLFLYILLLGILPSYFLIRAKLTEFSLKEKMWQKFKVFLILIILFVLLATGFSKLVNFPLGPTNPISVHLINIAKVAIPLRNFILRKGIDDKIALIENTGSCVFCNLSQVNFNGKNLKNVDLSFSLLSGADLRYANLSGANLDGVDLSNQDLTGTILSFSDLTGAKLDGVDLSNKDLNGTILRDVDLSMVDLTYKNLSGAILGDADLSSNDLTGTVLSFSNLIGANLDGVDIKNKDLTGVGLNKVDLSNQDLSGTILSFANFTDANLDGVDLSNKDLNGTIFNGVDFRGVDLRNINLSGAILKEANLVNKDLTGTILSFTDLSGANLDGVDLTNKDLSRVNLSRVDLSNKDLTGVRLSFSNLEGANLEGVDLSNKDLTGVNLSEVNLKNKDLTGTILTFANLTRANLDGVDLRNKDLTGTILSGIDLSNFDLSGTILKGSNKIEIIIKKPPTPNWPALSEVQNLAVTRYDLSGNIEYLSTKEGFLYESKYNESKLVLDLNDDNNFPFFVNNGAEVGLLGIASQDNLIYIAYTNQNIDSSHSLIVDEYSMSFSKVRNIIEINDFGSIHFGGNLLFDNIGRLYLSVGDGSQSDEAQNLGSLKGKILRLDTSELKQEPEIIAYGVRNPWGVSIDSNDRMFVLQCGAYDAEAVYLLKDIYSGIPENLGWPVFEGTKKQKQSSITLEDVLSPIFEYRNRPGCATAGVYLDDIESFLFADFFGTVRIIKQQENDNWYLLLEDKKEKNPIYGFGFDNKTKKIFIAPDNRELEIFVDQVKINQ
jgi:uncharacterized protein YjbI with pentapeptide repeats